ncbi:MAG: DivIVA domain-containing protein [Armatimonadota bacterium]|nr:DivIVA domain-containing protein [Armatimonadota bacterium]
MELTPIDILHVQFKRGLRGYSTGQVDEFLHNAASTLETLARERADLREQVERLTAEVNRCREIETTMHNALVLAQKTADELKANAHREADVILREAEQKTAQQIAEARAELSDLKAQIVSLREDRDRFENEFRSLIRSCSEWLDRQSARQSEPAGEGS